MCNKLHFSFSFTEHSGLTKEVREDYNIILLCVS